MTQKMRQKWVSGYIIVGIYNKKQSLTKRGLCGALHLDMLFQTKKFKYVERLWTEKFWK